MAIKISDTELIFYIATFSRFFYIFIAFLSSRLLTDYDKSTKLTTTKYFAFLLRWDGINFYTIVKEGYVSEHIMAFFPLYPCIVYYFSKISKIDFLYSGILVSNLSFIFSAVVLFSITIRKFNRKIAFLSCIYYCFNPASIINSSFYSESLFNLLFFLGYFYHKKHNLMSSIFFNLCAVTRSNGIIFVLFPLSLFSYSSFFLVPLQSVSFLLFQLYSWLSLQKYKFYIPYSLIQSKYWDQGFLQFYRDKKNIPNFFVGAPFIVYSLYLLNKYKFDYLLVFVLYLQIVMCLFLIHMQIYFRFVCYNPFLYWAMANELVNVGCKRMWMVNCVYFCFSVAYAILFGAYYPPA